MIARARTYIFTVAAGLSVAVLPGPVAAQSEADQEACTPDVFRLCQEFIPNEAPIVACLQAKRAQLSPACGRVFGRPAEPGVLPQVVPHKKHARRHRRHSDAM